MREVLHRERHVGVAQEFLVLVAVRVECPDDEGATADDLADTAGDVGFRPRHASNAHCAVQGEVDAVERPARLEVGDHGIKIETLELLGIVEGRSHRVRQGRIVVKHLDVQLGRPPVTVGVAAGVHDGTFACALVVGFRVHVVLRLLCWCCPEFEGRMRAAVSAVSGGQRHSPMEYLDFGRISASGPFGFSLRYDQKF